MGAGGSQSTQDRAVSAIDVRVTLIAALDTLDGQNHRDPPGPYTELQLGQATPRPATSSSNEWVQVPVTNTYDLTLAPLVTSVARGPNGTIVGGGRGTAEVEIQPGATGTLELSQHRPAGLAGR